MENLGLIKKYQVLKETPLGYMISYGKGEYFLHRSEVAFQKLRSEDVVEAFIYLDKKGRLAATLHKPTITLNEIGFVKVTGVLKGIGVFIDIGISKDILVSSDDLSNNPSNWPLLNDILLCKLIIKKGRLLAKPLFREELPINNTKLKNLDIVDATIIKIFRGGIHLVTNDYHVIYVYEGDINQEIRLGKQMKIKITGEDELSYRGIFIAPSILDIKNLILEYLKHNHGTMTITEKSNPEVIKKTFKVSKKVFKEAISRLYKEGKINLLPNKIILL